MIVLVISPSGSAGRWSTVQALACVSARIMRRTSKTPQRGS
jgi:hypothetical protein